MSDIWRAWEGWLRRVYGSAWDRAPRAMAAAVAVIVVSNLLALALTAVWLLAVRESLAVTTAVLVLVVIVVLVDLGLAALLLRGSRLVWALFVAFHASALALTPEDAWEVPGYVSTAVVLVLLLAPATVRSVWRARLSPYAPTYSEVQRPD